jgi:NADH:ubiquinone oxidoreductase subunit E
MSAPAKQHIEQPVTFAFTPENLAAAQAHIAKYPAGWAQSALLPLLTLAQKQHQNWLPVAAIIGTLDVVFGEIDR